MNDMIFDLTENCEQILGGRKYITTKGANFEQTVLIKYLLNKGLSEADAKDIWYTTRFEELKDVESSVVSAVFRKFVKNGKDIKFVKHNPIKIYDTEIAYFNSMNIPMWEKQYFLTLLCVYKYYEKTWVETNERIRKFCFSVSDAKHERERHSPLIADDRVKYNLYDINTRTGKNDKTITSIKFTMPMNNGKVIAELPNPRYIDDKLLGLLTCEHVCSRCGTVYKYTSKGINNFLCPKCYKKERYKRANSYKIQQT